MNRQEPDRFRLEKTMQRILIVMLFAGTLFPSVGHTQKIFERDMFKTPAGDLGITFIGHGTLMLSFGETIVHIDPVSRYLDYTGTFRVRTRTITDEKGKTTTVDPGAEPTASAVPKADLILVTHEHGDHLDTEAIAALRTGTTQIALAYRCAAEVKEAIVVKNGDKKIFGGLSVEVVPAYNLVHKRESGDPYHPQGAGNGYVIEFGGKRLYVAGDTENTPEMKALKKIDIAFLPMNLPYTMTPEMVADAAKGFKPKILYPYHFGRTDPTELLRLLKDTEAVEVRIRDMK